MKAAFVLTCLFAFCLLAINGLPALSSQEPKPMAAKQTLPGKMVFDEPGKYTEFAGDKGKTDFDHAKHAAKDACVVCHHTNIEKLTAAMEQPVAKCTVCHKLDDGVCAIEGSREGKTFKGKNAIRAEDAFHGGARPGPYSLVGCIGCHQERDIPPKTCTTCHQKE